MMDNAKQKKLQSLLQKLMVIVAVLLLIACFATGATLKTDGPSEQSLLWMLSLMVCIGAVGLCISGGGRPLGWVLVGSFLGSVICLCELLGLSGNLVAPGLFFGLYLLEFALSAGYGICRRLQLFD